MSTYRGIALVSETLRHLLQKEAGAAVRGTQVRIGPPEEMQPSGSPVINIFLYTATHTAYGRNLDEPRYEPSRPDRSEWHSPVLERVHQPTAILELDYLISFSGRKNTTDAEELLGVTIRTMEMHPFLTEAETRPAAAVGARDLSVDDMAYPAEVYPLNLDAHERARLWSIFFQIPYRLSTEYRVRSVAIPADVTRESVDAVLEVRPNAAPMLEEPNR